MICHTVNFIFCIFFFFEFVFSILFYLKAWENFLFLIILKFFSEFFFSWLDSDVLSMVILMMSRQKWKWFNVCLLRMCGFAVGIMMGHHWWPICIRLSFYVFAWKASQSSRSVLSCMCISCNMIKVAMC